MKSFGICYNNEILNSAEVKDKLVNILNKNNISVKIMNIDELVSGYDFVFVVGGDGTILKAARFYSEYQTPIFGINLGRLGFLSQSSQYDIEKSVEKILNDEYLIQDRVMLSSGNFMALNDFVIKGCDTGRTTRFSLRINGNDAGYYLADGMIIATPTGSTAYCLSAGGPVIEPSLKAFVIVPICPHTLTARPIVVPDSEVITLSTDGNYILSCDGQELYELNSQIQIKKSNYSAKLALLKDTEFYSVLRDKFHWAVPPVYQ